MNIDEMSVEEVDEQLERISDVHKKLNALQRKLTNRKILLFDPACYVVVGRSDGTKDSWRVYGAVRYEETIEDGFSLRFNNPGEVRINFYSGITKFVFTLEKNGFHFKECPDMQEFDSPDASPSVIKWSFDVFDTLSAAKGWIATESVSSPAPAD